MRMNLRSFRVSSIQQRLLALLVVGLGIELICLLYFVREFSLLQYYRHDTDLGGITNHSHAGFVAFVTVFVVLFALMALGWWLVRGLEDRGVVGLVFVLGAVFGATMTFVYPVTAIDIYNYVDESRILVHYHQNPIFVPPSHFLSDPLMSLAAGWGHQGAPYGPLAIIIDAVPTVVVGGGLLGNLLALKALYSATTLFSGFLLYRILQRVRPERALGGAVLVAWNPLVLFEASANGHNDSVMVLFALLAMAAFVRERTLVGMLLLVASVLVKFVTLLLVPLFLAFAIRRQPDWRSRVQYLGAAGLGAAVLAISVYAPFWRGFETLHGSLLSNQRYVESFSTVILTSVPGLSLDNAVLIGRLLFVPVYGFAMWIAVRSLPELARASFIASLGFLALAITNFKVWYGLLAVALGAAVVRLPERVSVILFACGATLSTALYSYVWWWRGLGNPGSLTFVNNLAYLIAFLPAIYALVYLSLTEPRDSGEREDEQPVSSSRAARR